MRALAVFVACCVALAATPSQAVVRYIGPHPGGLPHRHGQNGQGGVGGVDTDSPPALAPADETASFAPPAPDLDLLPALHCPAFIPAPIPPQGPRIIYIGRPSKIDGPKVIYGTQ